MKNSLISIVVTCHNYGRYLQQCLDSIFSQNTKPSEVIVVDDASRDETSAVCAAYGDAVRYVYGEFGSPAKAKIAGWKTTQANSAFLLWVDADNWLPPNFVSGALAEFTSHRVGAVYPDLVKFDGSSDVVIAPDFDPDLLSVSPFIDNCSLIRREALDVIADWSDCFPQTDDYKLFQLLAEDGWEFRKNPVPLMYRVHPDQDSAQRRQETYGYPFTHGLSWQKITLFLTLTGQLEAWSRQASFLKTQTYPHERLKLVLCDASGDPSLRKAVRTWLGECDYHDTEYFSFNHLPKETWIGQGHTRWHIESREANLAWCRIYNQMRRRLQTSWIWILQDSIIPPTDALLRLLPHFYQQVGTVSAPYDRQVRGETVSSVWTEHGNVPGSKVSIIPPDVNGRQVAQIAGSGFGCLLIRSSLLRNWVFRLPAGSQHFEVEFFKAMEDRWERLCDWSCRCENLETLS